MNRRRRRRAVWWSAVLVAFAVTAGVVGLTRFRRDTTSPYDSVVAGLCTAERRADAGDTNGARTAFLDQAHAGLHELAAATQQRDRTRAGALLEAKERVETDLSASSQAPLPADLRVLVDRTVAATIAVGQPSRGCSQTGTRTG